MDDDGKKILLLKLSVGFLTFVGILVVIVIILNLSGGKKKNSNLETTTRRTFETVETTEGTTSSTETTDTTTTTETTTVAPTTEAPQTQAPQTQAPTTKKTTRGGSSGGGSSSGGGGSSSSGGGSYEEEPEGSSYTVVGSANSSTATALINKIHSARNGQKYQIAKELNDKADEAAFTYCKVQEKTGAANYAAFFRDATTSDLPSGVMKTIQNNSSYRSNIIQNSNDYTYIGVGVYDTCAVIYLSW